MSKAKEISVLYKDIKQQMGRLVSLCHDVESHYEVTADAYQRGYEQGYKDGYNEPGKNQQEAYQRGLNDAWECARKIILDKEDGGLDAVTYNEIFGYGKGVRTVLKTFTASEAIAEIQEYEQEKKDGVWIATKANEPSVDTTLKCSKCGYVIKIKPHETSALNFCPKCGDCKKP